MLPIGWTLGQVRIAFFDPVAQRWDVLDNTTAAGALAQAAVPHFSLYEPVCRRGQRDAGPAGGYVYPDPAVGGQEPVIRALVGIVASLDITIFDASGRKVHSATVTGAPTGIDGNDYYYDYVWNGPKASGVYFAVVGGKAADGTLIKSRMKFAVVK